MSGRPSFSLLVCLAALLFAWPCGAQEEEPLGRGPIVITSEMFSADNRANLAVFEGSVEAKTGDLMLRAHRMTVYYSEGGQVREIDAEGSVTLIRGSRVVTAGRAVYREEEQTIVFTGGPRAVKGGTVVTGSRMIYHIDDDRSIVEDSKVFLERKGS